MTGYTVHTGSTEAFADSYDKIFGAKKKSTNKKATKKKAVKAKAKKTRPKKKKS